MKRCSKCKEEKPLSCFSKNKNSLKAQCKDCHNKYVREIWYKNNQKKQIKSSNDWKKKNPERVLSSKHKCDISKELFESKPECCEICGEKTKMVLDHCHSDLVFRGWLCAKCNAGLGFFMDSISNLKSAINYLKKFSENSC